MTQESSRSSTKSQDIGLLWNPLNAGASEIDLRALLPAAQVAAQKNDLDRGYLIEVYLHIARAQTAQNKIAEARLTLAEAEKLLVEPLPDDLTESIKIKWLIEKGRLYISEKTPSQARAVFEQAYDLANQSGQDHFVVDVAQMMAIIEPQKTQQNWIMKAIEIAEKSQQSSAKRTLGSLYASLGWKQFDLHQYEKSEETFRKSLRHFQDHGTEREIFIAKWSIGRTLRAMNKTESALVIQKELLSELGLGGSQGRSHDGRLYEEVAECLQTLERSAEAQLYFELAYKEFSNDEWVTDNQPVKLKRMKDLGKVKKST
jgi:tetratricopeptide (TPR) repeat protein